MIDPDAEELALQRHIIYGYLRGLLVTILSLIELDVGKGRGQLTESLLQQLSETIASMYVSEGDTPYSKGTRDGAVMAIGNLSRKLQQPPAGSLEMSPELLMETLHEVIELIYGPQR